MRKGEKLPRITRDVTVGDALAELTRTGLGLVAVTDDAGVLIGVFTDGDLRRWPQGENIQAGISRVMTVGSKTLNAGQLATEALAMFHEQKIPPPRWLMSKDG